MLTGPCQPDGGQPGAQAAGDALPHGSALGPAEIARLVPHSGRMVLLDCVLRWSPATILCATASHLREDHPLGRQGRLPAVSGIEYGAQAMAVHGALLAGGMARPGWLASLRRITLAVARLDGIPGRLLVEARLLSRDPGGSIYDFAVRSEAAADALVSGRIAVMLRRAR